MAACSASCFGFAEIACIAVHCQYHVAGTVGSDDCDAIALIGANSVLSTARPRNRNFPHTCWTNFLPLASNFGDFDDSLANCCLVPYSIGVCGNG
eukprot:scaffold1265_cov38-Cyclotella_meneghiniana.AAC.3